MTRHTCVISDRFRRLAAGFTSTVEAVPEGPDEQAQLLAFLGRRA